MATEVQNKPAVYGLLAEFETAAALLAAVRRTKSEGYVEIDAFTRPGFVMGGKAVQALRRAADLLVVSRV